MQRTVGRTAHRDSNHIVIRLGQPVIGVDVISSAQVNYRMVEIKAKDIAGALSSTGKIQLLLGLTLDTVERTAKLRRARRTR